MKTFFVVKLSDDRVVIQSTPATKDEEVVNEIKANSWRDARSKCVYNGIEQYTHRYGYGYYDE